MVLEGGGVNGIALVGAAQQIEHAGYTFGRVAGTSAGAIVGSLYAAGIQSAELVKIMQTLDYTKFRDEGWLDRFSIAGKTLSVLFEQGVYEGDYLRNWLYETLAAYGIRTFEDLRITDNWCKNVPPEQRYKLVVVASDISRGRMVRLPWDYPLYDLDPNKQLVADAVRASMSIPFFYEPAHLGKSILVDGAMLSNFPIDLFDTTQEWPTFGVKLSARPIPGEIINPVVNTYDFGKALVETLLKAHDRMHVEDPCTIKRTIFIDTTGFKATNFDIPKEDQQKLFSLGSTAGQKFFKYWDFEKFKKQCPLKER